MKRYILKTKYAGEYMLSVNVYTVYSVKTKKVKEVVSSSHFVVNEEKQKYVKNYKVEILMSHRSTGAICWNTEHYCDTQEFPTHYTIDEVKEEARYIYDCEKEVFRNEKLEQSKEKKVQQQAIENWAENHF